MTDRDLLTEVIVELEAVERLVRRGFPTFNHPLLAKVREAQTTKLRPLPPDRIMEIWQRFKDPSSNLQNAIDITRALEQEHGIGEKT